MRQATTPVPARTESEARHLFVSDLYGMLLRSDATLSEYTRSQLSAMLREGLQSMQVLLRGLPL